MQTSYITKQAQLHVNGVGAGSATCDYEAVISIAVELKDEAATKESFKGNMADGVSADLPAILGATSMRKKDSVLILREGKEFIAFPGPGGYKIEWSPGTKLARLQGTWSYHAITSMDHPKTHHWIQNCPV